MKHFEIVVVSDLHLGARNARAAEFSSFLERIDTERLIINGDLFECPRLGRRLGPEEAEVLAALRKLADAGELTWVRGNHDPDPELAWAVLGLTQQDEQLIMAGRQRYLITHGDRWDAAMELPRLVIESAEAIYRGAQFLDRTHLLARLLKRRSKRFCRVVDRLRARALDEARQRGLAGVILGHTHVAEDSREVDVRYLNSGCWTERPAAFVGLAEGRVATYQFSDGMIEELSRGESHEPAPSLATA